MEIECFKCGCKKKFDSASQIWLAGWVFVTKDQYVCEHCSQLKFDNNFDIDNFNIKTSKRKEKGKAYEGSDE